MAVVCGSYQLLQTAHFTILLMLSMIVSLSQQERFGTPSGTIHTIDPRVYKPISSIKTFTLNSDTYSEDHNNVVSSLINDHNVRLKRHVSSSRDSQSGQNPHAVIAQLNGDHHTTLIVHWGGEGSDFILALAKNSSEKDATALYVSYDYGEKFMDISAKMRVESTGKQAVITKYYGMEKFPDHYVFRDLEASCIFTTDNSCKTMTRHCDLPFKPRTISLHRHNPRFILGLDEESDLKQLYLSADFGASWSPVMSHVKAFFWNFPGSDDSSRIFVHEEVAGGKGQVVTLSVASFAANSAMLEHPDSSVLLRDVVDLELKGEYLFATKSVTLFGSHNHGPTLQLWVSHKGEQFSAAIFPSSSDIQDFYVADASDGQLMVCVSHNNSYSDLYVSDAHSLKFTLSLEKVVYYNSKTSAYKDLIRSFNNHTFADVTKIEGVSGIYIASQQVGSDLHLDQQRSLITYDKGGVWEPLNPPEFTLDNRPSHCVKSANCSLHLTQMFHQLFPASRTSPILTLPSAPGLVVASGVLGSSLKGGNPDVFVSASAGVRWRRALSGSYNYGMADQGGIIVAVHYMEPTKELLYSINEGETWQAFGFAQQPMRVYGLLTEPGENTTIFTVFGSPVTHHSWTLIQVDLKPVFDGKKCSSSDYKMWSVNDDLPKGEKCLMGRVTLYERRSAHAACLNGEDFVRKTVENTCMCTREDFECDYGYEPDSLLSHLCIKDETTAKQRRPQVPDHCPPGTFYNITRGYRRVPGDSCQGGEEHTYGPIKYACPVKESQEFLLMTSSSGYGMLDLGTGHSTPMYTSDSQLHTPAVFDQEKNAVVYAEDGAIHKMSLAEVYPQHQVLLPANSTFPKVVSLAFDWTGRNVFYILSKDTTCSIGVVNVDHRYRRALYTVENAESLLLDPHDGYMYFTSGDSNQRSVYRASMDGQDKRPTRLFNASQIVGAGTPITFDRESGQLFWVDSLTNNMLSAQVAGSKNQLDKDGTLNISVVVRSYRVDRLTGSSGIAIFKGFIYVSFQDSHLVLMARIGSDDWTVFADYTSDVIGMIEVSQTSHHAMSACSPYHPPCSQLCLPRPRDHDATTASKGDHNRTCLCDSGYRTEKAGDSDTAGERCLCEAGEVLLKDGSCHKSANASSCASDMFTCSNGKCIHDNFRCDGDDDCHDGSDELDCAFHMCKEGNMMCRSGKCVPNHWRCDQEDDCKDGVASDELNCEQHKCLPTQFQCDNKYCISKAWLCDMDDDCHDNSDEKNCGVSNSTCSPWEFQCGDNSCVDLFFKCNGRWDCVDGFDEIGCGNNTCSDDYEFNCGDSNNTCIIRNWVCDREEDCPNGRDEQNCPTSSPNTGSTDAPIHLCVFSYTCENRYCVGWETLCNGVDDCGDNSDEIGCDGLSPSTTPKPSGEKCSPSDFECQSVDGKGQICLPASARCDGKIDCHTRSDEIDCDTTCTGDQFKCEANNTCIWRSWVCDSDPDCPMGEDERDCEDHRQCGINQWMCVKSGGCIEHASRCDNKVDCDDASDELGCPWLDDIDCSIFDKHLEACCQEDRCGFYTSPSDGGFFSFFKDLSKDGRCYSMVSAPEHHDHNLCGSSNSGRYSCGESQMSCDFRRQCVYYVDKCNGHHDCHNGRDEMDCDCDSSVYNQLPPPIEKSTNTSITFIMDPTVYANFSYSPVISDLHSEGDTYGRTSKNMSWVKHPAVTGSRVKVVGLKPATHYSFVFQFSGRHCVSHYLSVLTEDGLPSAPRHLSLKVSLEEAMDAPIYMSMVDASWEPPANTRGIIHYYVIYYQKIKEADGTSISDVYEQRVDTDITQIQNVASGGGTVQRLQERVWEHIDGDGVYDFWVAAATKAGVGDASAKQKVRVSSGPVQSLNVKAKVIMDSTIKLSWTPRSGVKGYKVTVAVPDPVVHIPEKIITLDGSETFVKIKDLCPGTSVSISIAAKYGKGDVYEMHPKDNLVVHLGGKRPEVKITDIISAGPTSVLVSYKVIQGKVLDQYLIYYSHDLSVTPNNVSALETSHTLRGLFACERYFVWVRPSHPLCPAYGLKTFLTQEDILAPPRNVKAVPVRDGDRYSVTLTWRPSCGHHFNGSAYVISMQAGNEPESEFQQKFSDNDETLKFTIPKVVPGVTYKFKVTLGVKGARSSNEVLVKIPSLDGPLNLIMLAEGGNTVLVRWDWLPLKDTPEFKEYILYTTGPDGLTLTNHTARSELSLTLVTGGRYEFKVEVRDKLDRTIAETRRPAVYMYEAEVKEPSNADSGSMMGSTKLIAILVPVGLVVALLSAALVFFIVRHKRLQRSFLAFANSHYNIQSGTTTFSDDLDGDEPLIQGFSDDEPLVIA